mmetsp:Transcript_43567/g.86453  ORF Transcript_43567/g.86453 Transcript_43567/m.86453 type:complete len:98 (-) Transcript_43567:845-1138(-)
MPMINGLPNTIPSKFMGMPAFRKSRIFKRPVAKTTELGGVAAGSKKANEHATVAGSINARGWVRVSVATEARMGSITLAVAVFDVTSVRKHIVEVMR